MSHDPLDTGLIAVAAPLPGQPDGARLRGGGLPNSRFPTTCPVGDVAQLVDAVVSNGGARVMLEATALVDVDGDGLDDHAHSCGAGAEGLV